MSLAPTADAVPIVTARPRALAVIAAAALLLVGAIAWLCWERIAFVRAQALESERLKNDNLAIAHAETVTREIERVDQLLRLLRDDLRQRALPEDLAPRVAASGLAKQHVIAVSRIDEQGRVRASTIPGAVGSDTRFDDRDYFRLHAAQPEDRLHVGVPVQGRLTGQWVLSMTRRVERPGGGFGGVMYAAVSPELLSRLYELSALGEGGSLALIGLDGMTRVRRNGTELRYGGDVRRSQLFEALARAPAGHYVARAASDGVRRIVSYRQLDEQPLVVVVASSLDDVQAQTADVERAALVAGGGSSLLVLCAAALAARSVRRDAQAAARLAEAERRHRLLLDNSFDAILRTAPDGRVLAANAAACRVFGCSEAVLCQLGRGGLTDATDPRLAALLAERQARGRASGRVRMRRADGSLFEAEVNSVVYTDADGASASSLTVRDLSEVLAAEAERARFEQRLREAQKLESIGTLAGGIAHDFNNTLAAILGNAELLRQDLGDTAAGQEALQRIERSAQRGRSLVQQILTFSRRRAEQRQVQPLQPLLREGAALLRATLPAAVRLELVLPDAPLAVACDGTQVQQVLMNLCTNAWQAMPGRQGRIDVTLQAEDGMALLRVQDDGQGMDAATLERVFEPFFTTKAVGEGTGLGLAVVHGIVTAHGGAIAVHSRPGLGTTFEIRLPLAAAPGAPAVAPARPPAAVAGRGQGERVLYVDDDAVLAITVESLLQRAGWQVRCCATAAEALALLRADVQAFDAVVTDYNMPGLSGLDLCAELQRLRPELPVVVTSGYVSDDMLARARALGVRHVMLKEYTLERLMPLLRSLLTPVA